MREFIKLSGARGAPPPERLVGQLCFYQLRVGPILILALLTVSPHEEQQHNASDEWHQTDQDPAPTLSNIVEPAD